MQGKHLKGDMTLHKLSKLPGSELAQHIAVGHTLMAVNPVRPVLTLYEMVDGTALKETAQAWEFN